MWAHAHRVGLSQEDGTYEVTYKPSTSGNYRISVTLNGVSLPNSPFQLEVLTPAPDPPKCVIRGEALTLARAREIASFEVEFVDALSQVLRRTALRSNCSATPVGSPSSRLVASRHGLPPPL